MGKLDPLLWLPPDDLLIEGVNDILHLSGEEGLLKRPEARLPWDGDLWFRSAPVGIWFQRVEERRRTTVRTRAVGRLRALTSSSSSTKTKSEESCRGTGVRGATGAKRREWMMVSECRGMGDRRVGS